MATQYDVIVAGHLCLDIFPDMSGLPPGAFETQFAPGRLLEVGPVGFSTGGAVSNTGLALNRLGMRAFLMGKIGKDLFGQAIQQIIASHGPGLADGLIVDPAAASSYSIVINPPDLDRMFLHCPGANDTFTAEDVRYDLATRARLFHFGYPPIMKMMYVEEGRQLAQLFRRVKGTGATTSLDLSLPDVASPAGRGDWRAILAATLPHVDIFLPSIEEILFMLRRPTCEELRRQAGGPDYLQLVAPELLSELSADLLRMGPAIVGLKLGHRGFYIRTAGREAMAAMGRGGPLAPHAWADKELWAPCFRVQVAGTTGSGDSTIAGFLAALLRGLSPEEAITAAVAVGACNVEAPDALSGVRPWGDTLHRIAAGWPRHELSLSASGWRFDPAHQLWRREPAFGL